MVKKKLTRCFISLELPSEAVAEINNIQNFIKEKFTARDRNFQGNLTALENLHLTLKFLGELDNDKIKKVRERLRTISFSKFTVQLGKVGVFSEKIPRIVWIKLSGAEALQKEIDNCL